MLTKELIEEARYDVANCPPYQNIGLPKKEFLIAERNARALGCSAPVEVLVVALLKAWSRNIEIRETLEREMTER